MWTKDIYNYQRRKTQTVQIGTLTMGGDAPIRIQSMGNCNTNDTTACVQQAARIIDAGGELVRFTAQGTREAANLQFIRAGLNDKKGQYAQTPLVADIHFMPAAADEAALHVEKVRINPGNYVDKARVFKHIDYTDEEYAAELQRIRERFLPFLKLCKQHHTAIRIGVNHGSLSDRIMSRYGDTPEGMVESCMEFLRICVQEEFPHVVISIKASNTVVMITTVRLLVQKMQEEHMTFPLHLGVTEAGDGEDGRIKSAVGIGALLADGIGDTIRVSLSEAPEAEIPVAKALVNYIQARQNHAPILSAPWQSHPLSKSVGRVGGGQLPVVLGQSATYGQLVPDFVETPQGFIDAEGNVLPVMRLDCEHIQQAIDLKDVVLLLSSHHANPVGDYRSAIMQLRSHGCLLPIVACVRSEATSLTDMQLQVAADMGVLFIDGLLDGLYISHASVQPAACVETAFGILQAARVRTSKTEYISCPSCGRTLFDLEKTLARIKAQTSHLKGLKIGVMGCIVNGPGEMADADYGYVGAGRGKVSLYKQKQCIEKNIPEEEAVDKLIELIRLNGDWQEA
ncbi:MAG: (E)-4-hydroxy-3-methylbut-2-enyl-diphosphate synthase [Paludibacteraceae bacterium]|nr:(E)-4-hydroxy-3-methylbut-2-enyl-diphosphate synthase [Paludibacteraceae bacterium]